MYCIRMLMCDSCFESKSFDALLYVLIFGRLRTGMSQNSRSGEQTRRRMTTCARRWRRPSKITSALRWRASCAGPFASQPLPRKSQCSVTLACMRPLPRTWCSHSCGPRPRSSSRDRHRHDVPAVQASFGVCRFVSRCGC